ncbi:SusC/RagA family TonB-linked outer membrane protein [Segetibacter aerophilus]|nr:TonB-dependent receptor [Segetibacter aerophilus]
MLATSRSFRWGVIFILMLSSSISFAQRVVTGRVTGVNDQAASGATVTVTGTNVATQTDANGNYTITLPAGRNSLTVTYVGTETQTVTVTGATANVSLRAATTTMSEVVVTGYTAQRRRDITGSVAVVDVGSLRQQPTGNVSEALQGRASGVTILTSGQPGGAVNVMVRGITSIGSSAPLVIIDGTPGNLNNLNVNDIESVQVLKDAGAASIYGVRGSNGVVIVTTRRGRSGKVRVSYDGFYGTQIPVNGGKNPYRIANTQETADAVQRSFINSGLTPSNPQYGSGTTPVIPDYITPTAAMAGDPRVDPSKYALYSNQITQANKVGTDWFNEIFDPAPIQSHNISVGSGGDRSNYFLSLNYFNQEGTLMNTYLKRYSARINTTFNIANKVRVGENAYIFYRSSPGFGNQNEGNAISHAYRQNVIIPVYDIKGNFAGTGSAGLGNAQNPVAIRERARFDRSNQYQVSGNLFAELDFLRHFTARTSFGGTIDNNNFSFFSFTAYENAENNRNPNAFTEGYGYNTNYTWTNTLTYNNVFNEKHNLRVLVGSEAIKNLNRNIQGSRSNYLTNPNNLSVDPQLMSLASGSPVGQQNTSGGPNLTTLFSLFSRVDYTFADRYILSGTVRRDGSSVFAPENRFGVFPSVTAGWRISREKFFPVTSWINELKLRGGSGVLGSISNITATNAFGLFNQNAAQSYYDIGGQNTAMELGFYQQQIGNVRTTWEEDIITNVGLDATLFSNKVDFSLEWYKKSISGLLFRQLPDPTQVGPTQPFVNAGNIQNTGIDASLSYRGKFSNDFTFDLTATYTSYNNKVVSLPAGRKTIPQGSAGSGRIGAFTRLEPGIPLGSFYGYDVVGLFQSAEDVTKSAKQQDAAPGRLKFRDVDNNGVINDNDRTYFGNPNPDFTTGLNISLNYKNFDFSTFLYASVGNDVINYVRYWIDFPSLFNGAVSKDAVYNSWTPQNLNAKVPILERSANFSTNTQFSSYYLENGSFLKMRSLVFGYTVPAAKLRRIGAERLRIYFQAANLFTATKYTGLDPELINSDVNNNTNFGIDFGAYPSNQKNFNLGINLSF